MSKIKLRYWKWEVIYVTFFLTLNECFIKSYHELFSSVLIEMIKSEKLTPINAGRFLDHSLTYFARNQPEITS